MKILKKLCLLIPIFLIFILSSCSPDVYELDLENFDTTITYKDEVDINNIKIKNVSKDEVISLTNEMFTVPIKTDQVGDFEAKISYESLNFDFSYSVRYQITFDILGEKTISHVLSKDDLTIPEVSDTNDKVFSHFEPEIPEIINDNYEFMAIFKDKVNELPELASSYSVSYLDSTNDIKLPINSFGKWEFESETVFKEIKEYELNVIFHPFDQKYEEVHEKVIVNVKKRKFEFNNLVTEFTYDGKPHKVAYDNKDNVNILELNNKEEINVGSYDYEIIVKDDFYQGSISGKFIIKKAKLNIILPTITKEYTNGFSLTIDDIVNHKDFKILGNYVSLEDLKLSLVTKVTSAGKHTYEVKSNSTNYDCTFTKGEAIIDKGNINIDSLPTISSAAYLDKLGDLSLINNTFDMGAFTYKDPEIIIDKVGTYKVTLVFVPNDSNNYNTFEKEIKITVSKKILSLNDYLINDTFTYDAKKHSLIFDFKEYSNLITLDGNTGEINADIYTKDISINSEYFDGKFTAILKINKARPTFNIPEIEAKYNQKLGDIKLEVLDNGIIKFDNSEFVLNVIGNVKVNATFTPSDKQNYETVKFELTINVLKLESVITASNQESIFNNKEYSVIYKLNNKEQTLEFIYKLNGKVVNNIFNAGSYSVTIKAKESEHYLASEITITVKINKADYVLQEIEVAATYGMRLSEIKLPENKEGKIVFNNPNDLVGNVGGNKHKAKFIPNDSNYAEKEIDVIVKVSKKKLTFTITKDTFTYDGNRHSLEYKLEVEGLYVDGNNSHINADTYVINLEIVDDNYEGKITHNLIINKADPIFTVKELNAKYNQKLGDLTLDKYENGKLAFDNENYILNQIGKVNVAATFTPTDHTNYNVLHFNITINVLKLESVITASNQEVTFNNQVYKVVADINNSEQTLEYAYYLGDKVVSEIKNAGTYRVVIIVKESAHYLSATKEIKVIVNQATIELSPIEKTAVYGTKLSEVKLDTIEEGSFVFINLNDTVGNVGKNKHKAKFIPNDKNYKEQIIEITITVTKKTLEFTITEDTFTYDKKPHNLGFRLEVDDLNVTGNESYTNAGKYSITLNIVDNNYQGSITHDLTINKAKPQFNIPSVTAKYNQKLADIKLELLDNGQITFDNLDFVLNVIGNVTVNATFTPNDKQNYETVKFELTINVLKLDSVINALDQETTYNNQIYDVIYNLNNVEQNVEISITLNGLKVSEIKNAGIYKVTITALESDHYNATNIEITVTVNKADPVEITKELTAVYNTKLSEIKLDAVEGGIWQFVNQDITVGNVGRQKHEAKFIPNDLNYNTKTINIIINVTKLRLEFNIINHTYTYDSLPHKVEYSLSVKDLNVAGNTEHTKAGSYDITLRIDELNYEGSITTTLTILKADPEFISPVVSANYNQKLSEITLEKLANGVITFDNLNHILNEIGNVFVDATFTPNDQANYNIIHFKLTINVLKLESVITASNQEVTFNNQVYKVVANINNQEQTLEFTYTLNGKVVPEIKEVGTYNVVIVAKESAHYNEARKEIIVTVNPKQAIDPDKEINAVYGTKLSEINFDEVEGGRWTWVRPDDYVGEVGRRLHQAKFIPSSTSYEEKIVDVTIIVSKKVLKFNITKDTFTYDGKSHKLEYTLPVESLNVTGNTLYTNAGTYKVTLTIEETNYEGTITHNLIINKAKPIFEALKENYEVTIDDSINVLTEMFPKYDNGSINVDSLPQIFSEANSRNYKVVFVPTDTNNYQNVDINIRVTVLKKVANISGNDTISLDYTSQGIDLNQYYSLNHTDTKLVFSYNLNDSVVNNILNAGTYKVTIRASETAKYSSVSRTVTVIINKIEFKVESIILNATYGDLLSSLKYETSDYYVKFANPSLTVGDAGQNTLEVILVSKNDNYLDTKATITINVSKKHVNINVTRNEFTYDSNPHSIEYELDVNGLKVTGNSEYIDASTYQITLTIDDKNYEGSVSTNLIINKANPVFTELNKEYQVTIDDSIDKLVEQFPHNENGIIDVSSLPSTFDSINSNNYTVKFIPTDAKNYNEVSINILVNVVRKTASITGDDNLTYTFNNSIIDITNLYKLNHNETTLKFTYQVNNEYVLNIFNASTYKVTIRAEQTAKYNRVEKEITVVVNKANFDVKDLVLNATYGDLLSSLKYDNSLYDIKFTNPNDKVGNVGVNSINVKLISKNSNYNDTNTTISINVAKKELVFNITKDTFTYDSNPHKLEYTLEVDSIKVDGNNAEINAGHYTITLTINDANYTGTITHTLTINKALAQFEELKATYEVIVDDSIEALTSQFPVYANGSINVDSLPKVFSEAITKSYTVFFVPTDSTNYEGKEMTITVKVLKKDAVISGNESISLDYNGDVVDLNKYYSLNHNETKLSYTYRLNDLEVDNILNVGTYTVTITANETAKYNMASKTVTVVINKAYIKYDNIILEATYGDLLSSIQFENKDFSIKFADDSLQVGDAGDNKVSVTLVPKNDNYFETKAEITIHVNKKKVNITVTQNEFTYDATSHTIIFTTDIEGLNVTGNESRTDTGKYKIKLTIDEKNYEGQLDTELIILPKEITGITVSDGTNTYDFNQNLKIEFDKTETAHILDIKLNNEKLPEYILLNVNNENVSEVSLKENGKYVIKLVVNNKNYKEITHIIEVYIYVAMSSESTNYQNPTKYLTVAEALEATKNAQTQTYLYLFASDTLDDKLNTTYEIGKNVILYIPHELRDAYTAYTKDSDLGLDESPNNISRTPKLFTNLTINQNITVIVNGKIEIGANRGQAQPLVNLISTAYSQITLNGKLLVNGTIWVAGKIIGDGEITLNANSTLYEPFSLVDWRGGANASVVYLKGISPFNNYRLRNNECRTIINYGSNYTGYASIHASSKWTSADYKFIGTGAILELKDSNSKVIKYLDKTDVLEIPSTNSEGQTINGEYNDKTIEKMVFELYGNIVDNAGKLSVGGIELNTSMVFFPIGYSAKIIIKKNTNLTIRESYKILPGAKVIIEEEAMVTLDGYLIAYTSWNDAGYGSGTWYYPHDLAGGYLLNNGTIKLLSAKVTNLVQIGGIIYSTSINSKIIIPKKSWLLPSLLETSSKEGDKDKSVKIHEKLRDTNGNHFDHDSTYIYDGTKWNKQ